MDAAALLALVDRLLAGIEAGDTNAIRACYTDDVRIWHNFDQAEQTVEENLATLRWMVGRLGERRYEITRREVLTDGATVFQQHILHGTVLATGAALAMPAVLILTERDGHIARVEEYLDTAQAAVLTAKPTATGSRGK